MNDLNGVEGKYFQNWANTYSCRPELYFEPDSVDDLKKILKLANENKKVIKVVGIGHSPSSIACTNDYMISLKKFNKILDIDANKLEVKIEAGVRCDKLNDILYDNNMALSVLGSISDQTLAGVLSTGYHGTGKNYGILNSYVTEVEMMLASGEIKKYSKSSNSDEFGAVLCSLGCLGILLNMTIQCEPAFKLEQIEYGAKLEDVLESLDAYLDSSDHFRMLWYPHTDYVMCYNASRTTKYAFECSIPIKETSHYLLKLKAWLENNSHVKVHFGVEIRFVKGDDIWISPSYKQDSCWINILMFRPYGKEYEREEWWKINENLMIECNGRPHWAKTFSLKKPDLVKLYTKFDEFDELRKRLDPNGIFVNDYLKNIFY